MQPAPETPCGHQVFLRSRAREADGKYDCPRHRAGTATTTVGSGAIGVLGVADRTQTPRTPSGITQRAGVRRCSRTDPFAMDAQRRRARLIASVLRQESRPASCCGVSHAQQRAMHLWTTCVAHGIDVSGSPSRPPGDVELMAAIAESLVLAGLREPGVGGCGGCTLACFPRPQHWGRCSPCERVSHRRRGSCVSCTVCRHDAVGEGGANDARTFQSYASASDVSTPGSSDSGL